MKLVNIGFSNMVSADRIIAVVTSDSAPVKRMIQEAKTNNTLIDATYGRKTKSVLITDSDYLVISALESEEILNRLEER